MNNLSLTLLLAGVLATAAPLIIAALGETLTEKAGVINLSLDGSLLLSAMVGFMAAYESGSFTLGFAAAAVTGAVIAALVGIFGIYLGQLQVAVGFALTLMCKDLAYFLGNPYARLQGPQLLSLELPWLSDIPLLGPVLFRQPLVVYLSLLLIALVWWYLYRTGRGLELRAVGENPEAAYTRGIDPRRKQLLYTLVGGALVGAAGAAFSLGIKPGWGRPQGIEGIGWIALAIVIFGGWHPVKVALGALLFAFLQVIGISLQGVWPSIPAQVFQVAPFPMMILALLLLNLAQRETFRHALQRRPGLALLVRRLQGAPPRALGQNFKPDR
ncbi:MAG: ABC transporter permease [Chromatiaceae bacterium]|nr:ABC transporter permease [Gammaproteobacteria bacterium]MCB1871392.1 ABC transporter permease [Gammaproteobacteria bacterium]MCB1880782.1 ABC transporter permease [Gammaproteobacteria bacterium]MCP5427770.1 ABC transporter permease [Chromatiaceae bacterium]MCP5445959.1 ABC transporter permease [Chromatiaceae bacterium]